MICDFSAYFHARLMCVQIQIYKCQSNMHKMSNVTNACNSCFILTKKDVGHMQRIFTHTSLHSRTYADTRVENRQDRKKYWGARVHVRTCTRTYVHRVTSVETDKTEKILGRQGKMHCPLKVSRAMKTIRLQEATISLRQGEGGKEKDDPQRLRKVDFTEIALGIPVTGGWGQR